MIEDYAMLIVLIMGAILTLISAIKATFEDDIVQGMAALVIGSIGTTIFSFFIGLIFYLFRKLC